MFGHILPNVSHLILVQLSQVWADGRFAASNLDPKGEKTGHVDLSQREHVRIHLAPQTLPEPERVLPGRTLTELVDNDRIVGGVDPVADPTVDDSLISLTNPRPRSLNHIIDQIQLRIGL